MKEIMILVAVAIAITLAIGYRDSSFADACRAAGGTPVIGAYNKTCYEPGVAIDVK
jgi:hypothetical protein